MLSQERRKIMMKKILVKINNSDDLLLNCDGFIIGYKDFSILFSKTYDISSIKKIINNTDKEVYVSLNRPVFNDELELYKEELLKLDKLGLNGIIIGDIAALTYNLKNNLILDQMHLNNSYYTLNHYYNNGLYGAIITNDITLDEINEIKSNTNVVLFKQVFGYPHLSTSKRKLITNYFKHFNMNKNSNYYEIKEDKKDDYYKIVEDSFGTHILGDKPLNLLGININTNYYIIDGFMLDNIKEVVDIFMNNDIEKKEYLDNKYNASLGFINKETIYKVKNDEK